MRPHPYCPDAPESACDDEYCPGWFWSGDESIERCDACHRFADGDVQAMMHVDACDGCQAQLQRWGGALVVTRAFGWEEVRPDDNMPGGMLAICTVCQRQEVSPRGIDPTWHRCPGGPDDILSPDDNALG